MAPFYGPGGSSMTKSLGEFFVFKSPVKLEVIPVIGHLFAGNHQQDVQHYALLSTAIVCLAALSHG